MSDLVEFLRTRFYEDERVALAASPNSWKVDTWTNDKGREFLVVADYGIRPAFGLEGQANADHIARHDPDRVLAEVAVKRRIIEVHGPPSPRLRDYACASGCLDRESLLMQARPCETLRLLALPYAGHRDYRQEWAL